MKTAIATGTGFLVLLMMLIGAAFNTPAGCGPPTGPAVGVDPASIPDRIGAFGKEQLVNAAAVMLAGRDTGMTLRDQQIAVMTAMGESDLINVDRGDAVGPDSRGIFQQRDNGAWGTYEDRMNPYRAAASFYRALGEVSGRESMEPTLVANRVQRNADPWHYRRHWDDAVQVVAALAGARPAPASDTHLGTATTPVPPPQGPAGGDASGTTGNRYNLAPGTRPEAIAVANTVGPRFGVQTVLGYRPHARDPKGHPSGLALDFMVPLTPEGKAQGDQIAAHLIAHHEELGVEYIIWYQRTWRPGRTAWRAMGDLGDANQNHLQHVHVNIRPGASITDPGGGALPACGPAAAGPLGSGGWAAPTGTAPNTSSYGWRIHPVHGDRRFHYGTDYGTGCGSPIFAAGDGVAITSRASRGYGNLIEIDHGSGIITRYGHMYAGGVHVRVGDRVAAGQQIAEVGSAGVSTGCHLHFEVKINGAHVDPVAFLSQHGVTTGGKQ